MKKIEKLSIDFSYENIGAYAGKQKCLNIGEGNAKRTFICSFDSIFSVLGSIANKADELIDAQDYDSTMIRHLRDKIVFLEAQNKSFAEAIDQINEKVDRMENLVSSCDRCLHGDNETSRGIYCYNCTHFKSFDERTNMYEPYYKPDSTANETIKTSDIKPGDPIFTSGYAHVIENPMEKGHWYLLEYHDKSFYMIRFIDLDGGRNINYEVRVRLMSRGNPEMSLCEFINEYAYTINGCAYIADIKSIKKIL